MRVLILEDENKAARELSRIILEIDDTIKIVGVIDSIEMGKQWFENNEDPDLIFSDIQLADGLSLDLFDTVKIKSTIIFCTAFDEYLMNAFETNAISYLLKPITLEKVEKALLKFEQYREIFNVKQIKDNFTNLLSSFKQSYKSTLLVHQKDKIIPVSVNDIAIIYLDGTMVGIWTMAGQKYYYFNSLDEIEKSMDPNVFYRANRQFIINRVSIDTVEKFYARKLVVKLKIGLSEQIVISKAKSSHFLRWLEGV